MAKYKVVNSGSKEHIPVSLLVPKRTLIIIVLADRGFTVSEDIALQGARLEIPAFTRGKKQLSQQDVEMSKQLSKVRIHVERVIGLVKNRYTILKGPMPLNIHCCKSWSAQLGN